MGQRMKPWEQLGNADAPDGTALHLSRRGSEYLIRADGRDLMSSHDRASSCSLGELGCEHIRDSAEPRVLIGGLGMGFTLRAALDALGRGARVDIAELVPGVIEWNRGPLGPLADQPLLDPRSVLTVGDVHVSIAEARGLYDAILLDVDNGPDALAHPENERIYQRAGIDAARRALRKGGVFAVWSYDEDGGFVRKLESAGFEVDVRRVQGSRRGRGRRHVIVLARI
jgi:spermidine synthase